MSAPQGPGWRQGPDGRWYPSQPQYPPAPGYRAGQQHPGQPPFVPPPKSSRSWLIPVLVIVGVIVISGAAFAWWVATKVGDAVSNVTGGTNLTCPTGAEISRLLGANVKGPTAAPEFFVAAACYYEPATASDLYEVIIVSGSKLIADDEIATMKSEGLSAGASPHSINVGDKGVAWASKTKSSAMAVGDRALVGVEVQGKSSAEIPNQEAVAVAILEKVIR